MEQDPLLDETPRSPLSRVMAWFEASPAELTGLAVLLLGALLVTGIVLVDAWRRPAELGSVSAVVGGMPQTDSPLDPEPWASAADVHPRDHVPSEVVVHVSGAVTRPGVVSLPGGSRVSDALAAVGGPLGTADTNRLNLARIVADGEQIHVPLPGEEGSGPAEADLSGLDADGSIDLNRATVTELESLPGIGPSKAAAIIEHREIHGPFNAPGDLRAVPGIGETTFQRVAERVTVR